MSTHYLSRARRVCVKILPWINARMRTEIYIHVRRRCFMGIETRSRAEEMQTSIKVSVSRAAGSESCEHVPIVSIEFRFESRRRQPSTSQVPITNIMSKKLMCWTVLFPFILIWLKPLRRILMTTMQTFYYVHLNQISVKLFELFNYIAMHRIDAFIVNIKCNFL